MYIGDKWYSESEIVAHVLQLQNAVHAAARILEKYTDEYGILDSVMYYELKDFESFEKNLPEY
ncbi:MAG: hypothetical protein J5723_02545 [Ruminococcus sp.]|nr:hypothetical protein [Ruminococcus sp.]